MPLVDREGFLDRLIACGPARSVADALFRRRAVRRLRHLDSLVPERAQGHILQKLVKQACNTRFGREHDFARVHTADDFRRLVPLRSSAELWRDFGAPSHPELDGISWPGRVPYLATCECPAGQLTSTLLVTDDLIRGHRAALLTALAFVVAARPHARLLSGSLLLVGGGTALTPLRGSGSANLEELTRSQLPALLRPYTAVAPYSGEGSLYSLAQQATSLSVTCLVGNAGRLACLAAILCKKTGRASLVETWPGLQAVLFSRGPHDPDRGQLGELVGAHSAKEPVLLLEGAIRPEGVVAIEDPRHGLLRLPPDHGIYFEFVPTEDLGSPRARRLSLSEVTTGANYALALTSAAGLWACLVGLTVSFASVNPPLFRSVESAGEQPGINPAWAPSEVLPLRTEPPAAPPHPQSGGTPAAPARRIGRTPWSGRADRG
jgi:hypothetical protein